MAFASIAASGTAQITETGHVSKFKNPYSQWLDSAALPVPK